MSTTQSYEDLQVKHETQETPESHLLHVHIPEGFAREHIGAKIEYDFGRVRVFGERALQNNKTERFNVMHQVPEYCDINKIRGRFVGQTVTITMQKDPNKVPKEEPKKEPSEQEEAAQEPEPKPEENEKEDTPQSSTTKDDSNQEKTTTAGDVHVPKSIENKEDTSPKDTQETMPQEGKNGISHKDTVTKVETKQEAGDDTPPPEATQGPISEEGKDGISQTQGESKESLPPTPRDEGKEAAEESMSQKGKEGISHEDTITTDAELQPEDKFDKEKKLKKEESEDHPKKALETEKESQEESEGHAKVESFSTKEINGKIGNDVVEKKDIPESTSTTRKRIKEVAASASQTVTNLAKRFNEEDKQKLIYMGTAVLVVALGVYATYKLRSSTRL